MTSSLPPDQRATSQAFHQRLRDAGPPVSVLRDHLLSHEGDRSDHVSFLASGFVLASKRTAKGQQQSVAIYLPGDIVDHESFTLGASRHDAVALTAVTFHKIAHSKLQELLECDLGDAAAFWRYVAFQGALAHDWLLNIGQRSAYPRTAHFLCEIIYRADHQPAKSNLFQLPLRQRDLAQTLGLSAVHVNRTMTRFRNERLISFKRGLIEVLDWPRFKEAAEFNPDYLFSAQ